MDTNKVERPDASWRNAELQSSLVRLAIAGLAMVHVVVSEALGYLAGDFDYYMRVLVVALVVFGSILASILVKPVWPARRVLTLFIDIGAITIILLPAEQAISPYCLLYLWVVVGYGARYGKRYLLYAALSCALAYMALALRNGFLQTQPSETFFFLVFLFVLPVYQYVIISARIEAEQATELKSRFLSTMTHELRTPLSGVIGMSRLMSRTKLDGEQREYVEAIRSASDVLMSLIGDILDFSKIEANKLEISKSPFDIRACIGAVCRSLSSRALEKGLELICRVDPDVAARLVNDELRLNQVLYNLIGNAIKFTDRGEVEVHVQRRAGGERLPPRLAIVIRDTGAGIPADKLDKLFDGFWQGDLSSTRRHSGTGLGTTISRELARLMGGDVTVKSASGAGAVFTVSLPLDEDAGSAQGQAPPEPEPVPTLAGRRFVLLEPNAASRSAAAEILAAQGAAVSERAEDASQADALLIADSLAQPDALPSALASVAGAPSDGVPVLILGYANRHYAPDLPRWRLVSKPFTAEQLLAALRALVSEQPGEAAAETPEQPAPRPARARVLVAEDDAISARVVTTLLQRAGHDVTLVDNGTDAHRTLLEPRFDLALLDVRLPGMSGIDVAERIRQAETGTGRHVPIIALTASAVSEVKQGCLAAGMDAFLLKPVDPALLEDVLRRFGPGNRSETDGGDGEG
jgi:two-component system sensor histidine kinase RpfC